MGKYKLTLLLNTKKDVSSIKSIANVYGGIVLDECEISEGLKKGDTIECIDYEDAIKLMHELEEKDIPTDFLYEKDGKEGLWLEVK